MNGLSIIEQTTIIEHSAPPVRALKIFDIIQVSPPQKHCGSGMRCLDLGEVEKNRPQYPPLGPHTRNPCNDNCAVVGIVNP